MITKSQCEHCGGGIEFETEDLESADQKIACPHCGQQTALQAIARSEPKPEMSDIQFDCESCGGSIVTDGSQFEPTGENDVKIFGQELDCPHCGGKTRAWKFKPLFNKSEDSPKSESELPTGYAVSSVGPATTRNEVRCNCQRCGERIVFPPEMAGQDVTCPHCGRETTLLLPQVRKAAPDPVPPTPTAMAEVSDGTLLACYVLSALLPLVGFFCGVYLLSKKQGGHGAACMAVSVFSFLVWAAIFSSTN